MSAADAAPACDQVRRAAAATSRSTCRDAVRRDSAVDRCPVCAGADFYIRKDFDPKVGLTVVIIGALISAVFYWFEPRSHRLQHPRRRRADRSGRLRPAERSDRLLPLPHRVPRRYPRTAPAFDLHTADVLEQEYERKIGRR